MYAHVDHQPPDEHQPQPADLTTNYLWQQALEWKRTETLIHPQTAMAIAAQWHSPAYIDRAITAFASHGEVMLDDLLINIRRNIVDQPYGTSAHVMLMALHAYASEIVDRDTHYRWNIWSRLGHRFLGTDSPDQESCPTCGGVWRLIPYDDEPQTGHYVASSGAMADYCSGDTSMVHAYPGERVCQAGDGSGCEESRETSGETCLHIRHDCNCLLCR